ATLSIQAELLETKAQLHDKQIVFDNILEGTMAGYWDWMIQEETEYLSPTFKQMFGYEDHELENSPLTWQRLIHPDDLPGVFEIFNKHVATKGAYPYDCEVRYFHKDGSIVWVFCRGKVIEWDEQGQPVRMVGSHVDITKLKQVERLENYNRLLEQKNSELEQFAYVASHDLQEPLRTITSFVEIFAEDHLDKLDAEGQRQLNYITQAAGRMSDLVKDLLDYSRLGKDRYLTDVDLKKVVNDIIKDIAKNIEESKVLLNVDALPTIRAYPHEIRVLFQNLLTNAIKFNNPDERPVVNITFAEEEKHWVFRVKDNGIGIAPKHQERIFVIFQRLHNQSVYEGTGIGLAQCKKIVELHRGEIGVVSEKGAGSTFFFTIPK
ncbi:MAG: PAS domain-containing protein, partial [Bacteroidota bacterium]